MRKIDLSQSRGYSDGAFALKPILRSGYRIVLLPNHGLNHINGFYTNECSEYTGICLAYKGNDKPIVLISYSGSLKNGGKVFVSSDQPHYRARLYAHNLISKEEI